MLRSSQNITTFKPAQSESIYQPYMMFKDIPSAEKLYLEILKRDCYDLMTIHSLDEVKEYLSINKEPELDPALLKMVFKCVYEQMVGKLYYFRIDLTQIDNHEKDPDRSLKARKDFIQMFDKLRYEIKNIRSLSTKANLKLFLTPYESYEFVSVDLDDAIPDSYRAMCIYDYAVQILYTDMKDKESNTAITRDKLVEGNNHLISDFLAVHMVKDNAQIRQKIVNCLNDTVFDQRAAAYLDDSYIQTTGGDSIDRIGNRDGTGKDRGESSIMLTANAYLDEIRRHFDNSSTYDLNIFSHYYFSLVQYRYLLALQNIISPLDDKKIHQLRLVCDAIEKAHAIKDNDIIIKCIIIRDDCKQVTKRACLFEERIRDNKYEFIIEPVNSLPGMSLSFRNFTQKESKDVKDYLMNKYQLEVEHRNHSKSNDYIRPYNYYTKISVANLSALNINHYEHREKPNKKMKI